jgi:hypothetical protein
MNSASSSTPIDLEAGLHTGAEDVLALRRAKSERAMSLQDYLSFLAGFEDPPPALLKGRRGPRGDTPFEL